MVSPIPDGYHSLTPYLVVNNGAKAIDFYKRAFDATELMRMADPSGVIRHAEIRVGDSALMLAEGCPEMKAHDPQHYGGTPVSLLLYVEDVDKTFQQALDAGAETMMEVSDKFYGDRSGCVTDPFGHVWTIATHVEDVSEEEMERRMEEFAKQQAG